MRLSIMRSETGKCIFAILLLTLFITIQSPRVSVVSGDSYAAEQLTLKSVVFEIGHVYVELANAGNSDVTIIRCGIMSSYSTMPSRTLENGSSNGLPIIIAANSAKILDVQCDWVPGRQYLVSLGFSDRSGFSREIGVSPTTISGVFIYKANINFYKVDGSSKIDVDIGNCGTLETEVVGLYVGTSCAYSQNQITTPRVVQPSGLARMTVNYDWVPNATYDFKAVGSSGQTINWTAQAPLWDPNENENATIVRIQPENITVKKDDVFSVDVMIENIPAEYSLAGVQLDMNWDPKVVNGLNMTEVMFHSVAPPEEYDNIWELARIVNQSFVSYAYCWADFQSAVDGGYASIVGNHTLATITFKAVGSGSTALHFFLVKVGDANGDRLICSTDELYAHENVYPSVLNHVIIDCNVNVETANASDATPPSPSNQDGVNGSLHVPASTLSPSENMPQIVDMMPAGATVVTAVILVLSIQIVRRRRKRAL